MIELSIVYATEVFSVSESARECEASLKLWKDSLAICRGYLGGEFTTRGTSDGEPNSDSARTRAKDPKKKIQVTLFDQEHGPRRSDEGKAASAQLYPQKD